MSDDDGTVDLDAIIAACKETGSGFNPYWTQRAIEEIEKLRRCLESRDNFLVSRDLFSDYVKTLD